MPHTVERGEAREAVTQVEDRLRQLYVDCGQTKTDSGYVSSSLSLLSEQTVDAMLRVRDQPMDRLSIMSEDHDMASICGVQSPVLPSPPSLVDVVDRGSCDIPPKAEVQLRYLLQLLIEAGCLEWASVVATLLRDAMAIIRIVNAARSAPDAATVVQRLHDGFLQLDAFSVTSGYRGFLASIQPQARSLAKFLFPSGAGTEASTAAAAEEGEVGEGEAGSQVRGLTRSVSDPGAGSSQGGGRTRSPSPAVCAEGEGGEGGEEAGCVLS